MTVNAITDTKKGEQGLRLLIFILPLQSSNGGCFVWGLTVCVFGVLRSPPPMPGGAATQTIAPSLGHRQSLASAERCASAQWAINKLECHWPPPPRHSGRRVIHAGKQWWCPYVECFGGVKLYNNLNTGVFSIPEGNKFGLYQHSLFLSYVVVILQCDIFNVQLIVAS